MIEQVSRRSFFKLISAAVVIASAPIKFISTKLKLSDIITTTFRNNKYKISDNLSRNNALLERLKHR